MSLCYLCDAAPLGEPNPSPQPLSPGPYSGKIPYVLSIAAPVRSTNVLTGNRAGLMQGSDSCSKNAPLHLEYESGERSPVFRAQRLGV